MKTIEVKCYEFDELSDQAKENALSNYHLNNISRDIALTIRNEYYFDENGNLI